MTTELTTAEIRREIDDSLSPAALRWWNGCDRSTENEMITLAQRDGVAAAVAMIESLAE